MRPIHKYLIMGSQTENDPFDLHDRKKVKIKEFLVYMESKDGQDNYSIKQFDKTKEQNLEALQYIQKLIKSDPNKNSERIKGYLKQQRFFMKLYLKEVNKNKSPWKLIFCFKISFSFSILHYSYIEG